MAVDGVITINVLKSTAEMDRILRRVFFEVVAQHPWLAFKSLLLGKPSVQYAMFTRVPVLWEVRAYIVSFVMALAAGLVALFAGSPLPDANSSGRPALRSFPS